MERVSSWLAVIGGRPAGKRVSRRLSVERIGNRPARIRRMAVRREGGTRGVRIMIEITVFIVIATEVIVEILGNYRWRGGSRELNITGP